MENRLIQVEYIMANDPEHARAWHAPEYEHGSAFINGDYCAVDSAAVPILDVGFIHADAAYDVVSASKGYIFAWMITSSASTAPVRRSVWPVPTTRQKQPKFCKNWSGWPGPGTPTSGGV